MAREFRSSGLILLKSLNLKEVYLGPEKEIKKIGPAIMTGTVVNEMYVVDES